MKKEIFEWIKTIVISIVIALIITTFIRPTLVKGQSMYPTLDEYDYLIINRMPYINSLPKHGDIIVFRTNLYTPSNKEKDLIKRVIGIPGDVIEIKEGKVYRNGEEINEPYINDEFSIGTNGKLKVEVLEDTVFVMGDNRGNSLDSRDERVGLVYIDDIKGKAIVRLYPFNKIGTLK